MPSSVVPPAVYPIPQEMALTGQRISLANAVIVAIDPTSRSAAQMLSRWIADDFLINLPVVDAAAPGVSAIMLSTGRAPGSAAPHLDVPNQPEAYALSISADAILAAGQDAQGTLYAVATLMQLLERHDDILTLPAGTIRDWPYRPIRYVHVYIPGKEDIPFFKRYVREFLLRYKFNGMILEVGGGVRLSNHPEIATAWKRTVAELYAHGDQVWKTDESCPLGPDNRFQDSTHIGIGGGGCIEPEDLRDIVAFARAHGQEVVPEIQSLSHVYYLACAHRDIAEVPDALFPDAYCPSNENSYKLLFEVMDEIIDLMGAKTVHIGHDEWRTGGLCPQCRKQSTADLFTNDVIRIYNHLQAKGIRTWMWGDHFVSMHNELGRTGKKGGKVWFDYPGTQGSWEKVKKACPDLVLLNWSWSMKNDTGEQGDADQELHDKGFRFLYGNFAGATFQNWKGRSEKHNALGAEISSWCRMNEFQIGKMHIVSALDSINLLWSSHYPPQDDAARTVMHLLPELSRRLKGNDHPNMRRAPERQTSLDLAPFFNAPLKGETYDLSGLHRGPVKVGGLSYTLVDGAILLRRPHQPEEILPTSITIPLNARAARVVFVQSSIGDPRRTVHAGDATFFPHESSELLAVYDIVFADGLTLAAQVRANENVARWDAGLKARLYHACNLESGTLPNGDPLVLWATEWTNPRPDERIAEIRYRAIAGPSAAQPLLLAITTVEKVRLSDYRP